MKAQPDSPRSLMAASKYVTEVIDYLHDALPPGPMKDRAIILCRRTYRNDKIIAEGEVTCEWCAQSVARSLIEFHHDYGCDAIDETMKRR